MPLAAGRTVAITAIKAAFDAAAAETDPAAKEAAILALSTDITDAMIALIQTAAVATTVVVASVSAVTPGVGVSGPGAGTGTGTLT